MDIVGKSIGRYEVHEQIGEGGMARVFRAYDPEIGRTGALKILKEEHCQNEEYMRRFLQEGKAAGALSHPNIVAVYDVGRIDGTPYILMEFLEGETLGDILAREDKIPLSSIVNYIAQIAEALNYAHAHGVVHRDMKPHNVILDASTQSIKIADFGIARVEEANRETTQIGMMLGTPSYMSPEQAMGLDIDGRSDLFTVGVILYEMVTGEKAFDAQNIPSLIQQIVHDDPSPMKQVGVNAPIGIQKIVRKLLHKKPEKRFQTGLELKNALLRERDILLEEQEERRSYLPLQVKWTAIMASIVAAAMALSFIIIFKAQSEVLTRQAIDSAISLTKFISVQAAIPLLGEDWVSLESLVKDASARETFQHLVVSDHSNIVRSATDSKLVGNEWAPSDIKEVLLQQKDVVVTEIGETFNVRLPVLFNETPIGHVDVGIDTRGHYGALRTTGGMLLALGIAIVLIISLIIYIFNQQITKNLLLATQALSLFRPDRLEARVSKERTDEFGDLFTAFNTMADAIEQQLTKEAADSTHYKTPPAPDIDISGITQRFDVTKLQPDTNDKD